jgi:hypothetical protein
MLCAIIADIYCSKDEIIQKFSEYVLVNNFKQFLKQNGLEYHKIMCMILYHEKINLGTFWGQKSYETTGSGMLGLKIIPYNEHSYVEYQERFTN